MLGVISANANGVRAALKRGGFDWIKSQLDSGNAEVVCLQEVRATTDQLHEVLAATGLSDLQVAHDSSARLGHAGVAIQAAGTEEQLAPAGGVALDGLTLDHAAIKQEVGGELRAFLVVKAEVRHSRGGIVGAGVLKVGRERFDAELILVAEVSEGDASVGRATRDFSVRALMATDATEVSKECPASEAVLGLGFGSGFGCFAHAQCRGDVGGFLRCVRAREDLRHVRARANGVRVRNPLGEEVGIIFRAEAAE